jgi:hypothetical protein
MPDLQHETAILAALDRHIAEGEERAASLEFQIRKSRSAKFDAREAERTLQISMEILDEWRMRRNRILDEMAHNDR